MFKVYFFTYNTRIQPRLFRHAFVDVTDTFCCVVHGKRWPRQTHSFTCSAKVSNSFITCARFPLTNDGNVHQKDRDREIDQKGHHHHIVYTFICIYTYRPSYSIVIMKNIHVRSLECTIYADAFVHSMYSTATTTLMAHNGSQVRFKLSTSFLFCTFLNLEHIFLG